jgi:hypothetical protein
MARHLIDRRYDDPLVENDKKLVPCEVVRAGSRALRHDYGNSSPTFS